ncbi:amidohydrolase 3 [Hyaloraphidium curvatum]|nr:amidohydrolase 3 [Hyaloraphidium curvatum]
MPSAFFRNGAVYTLEDAQPWAEAVVVHDSHIAFVGSEAEARQHLRPDTHEVDMRGGFLMPGFIDGHNHLIGGATAKVGVSLENLRGKDAVLEQIRRYATTHPHNHVIRGHGWTPFTFDGEQPHRTWLDAVTDVRPAYLHTYDVHDVWANTAAFKAAGIDASTPDPHPPTGYYVRDPDGFPAGKCCEPEAWVPIAQALGMFTLESIKEAMELTMAAAPSWGITTYFDAGTLITSGKLVDEVWSYLIDVDRNKGGIPVRLVGSHIVRDGTTSNDKMLSSLKQLQQTVQSPNITITTLKMFMDGVGPTHTASMLEDYADEPHKGGWVMTPDAALRLTAAANAAGIDVHIHACGDAGVRAALDAFENVRKTRPDLTPRNTVCHLEFCHPDDVKRFAELGVTANGTPVWGCDYRGEFVDAYPALVGSERFPRDYCPYGAVVKTGANVTFGADCPGCEVHEIAPLVQMEVAVTRRRPGRADDRPVGPDNAVSVAEALRCYTLNGAYALRLEKETGSIRAGKRADLVLLGASPFDVAPHRIHAIPVLFTMLAGRVTHSALNPGAEAAAAEQAKI